MCVLSRCKAITIIGCNGFPFSSHVSNFYFSQSAILDIIDLWAENKWVLSTELSRALVLLRHVNKVLLLDNNRKGTLFLMLPCLVPLQLCKLRPQAIVKESSGQILFSSSALHISICSLKVVIKTYFKIRITFLVLIQL